jgi:hypothetical protein
MDAYLTRKRRRSIEEQETTGAMIGPCISPPPKRNAQRETFLIESEITDLTGDDAKKRPPALPEADKNGAFIKSNKSSVTETIIPSPMRLNHIEDLPASSNIDTLKLSDLLGDPMIKECWLFNYLFDIDFIMWAFSYKTTKRG